MHFSFLLCMSLLGTRVSSRYALHDPRAIVNLGPEGTCPAAGTTTYEVQPVYYSDFIPTNTVFDPFQNGHYITVTNAPTVVVILAYITTIRAPSFTSIRQPDIISTRGTIRSSSPSSTSTAFGPPPPSTTLSPAATIASSQTGVLPGSSVTSGSSISSLSPNPLATTPTSPETTPTSASSLSIDGSSTISEPPPLTIGVGIPSGQVTSIPATSPILLAFDDLGRFQKRHDIARRQKVQGPPAPSPTSVSTVSIVNLATAAPAATDSASPVKSQDECDDATPFPAVGWPSVAWRGCNREAVWHDLSSTRSARSRCTLQSSQQVALFC